MPIQKKPINTVPILLNRVDEIIKQATEQSNQSNTTTTDDPLVVDLPKIRTDLQEMKDLFPKFNHCEEVLVTQFKSLQLDFDDEIFDNPTQKEKFHEKLNSISQKIETIKKFIEKIQLPEIDESPPASQPGAPSTAQFRQVSDDWLRLSVDEHILASPAIVDLQLSYDVLDLQWKLCFLCFAIFPFKEIIKKRPLIHWWIGEGLITKSKDRNAEEVGEAIFTGLIKKGLIVPVHKSKKSPIIDGCTIHPWIQRMLISVATTAQFFDFDKNGKPSDDYLKSHRAIFVLANEAFSGDNVVKDEELVTIFNVNEQYLSFNHDPFLKSRKLAILQLGRWQTSAKHHIEVENDQFLDELRFQKHLKYLNLQGVSRITRLPSSIVECASLAILDLRACHNLERLPSDISSFGKLTHLDISECYLLETMPKGIEKLSSLQVLKGFVIGHLRKNPCKLGDLIQLKKLRKLSIHIRSEAIIEEGELEKIKDFENLRVLTISWGGVTVPSRNNDLKKNLNARADALAPQLTRTATMTMSSMSLPPMLEKLDLRCFPRRMSPEWLISHNLQQLKRLYVRGGELQNLCCDSEHKWKVEILRLKYLKNLEVSGNDIVKGFPDLSYFEKVRCHQIGESLYKMDVEWSKYEGLEALKSSF